ncbi:hypothetical protein CEXT_523941 [Caerostris extrusa]|uniref:Uncharacterized protein n=1 Tax=Caerostris extrusa TaxID=172846 RepID=A0AAV4RHU6_CAEEX|nr:hypothetical protein CEXT_523941 [Caerostris extrusa]
MLSGFLICTLSSQCACNQTFSNSSNHASGNVQQCLHGFVQMSRTQRDALLRILSSFISDVETKELELVFAIFVIAQELIPYHEIDGWCEDLSPVYKNEHVRPFGTRKQIHFCMPILQMFLLLLGVENIRYVEARYRKTEKSSPNKDPFTYVENISKIPFILIMK